MSTRARIGLTGASGFLGGRILAALRDAGSDVAVLGRQAVGDAEHRPWMASTDPAELGDAVAGLDTLVHAAAHVPADMRDPAEAETCLRTNALATLALARAGLAKGLARFVFVSSANVVERRETPVPDDAFPGLIPANAPYYLSSKLLAEVFLAAQQQAGLDVLILRPSSIYGPGMKPGILTRVAEAALGRAPLRLQDGGRHSADYVHVDDVAWLTAHAALSDLTGHLNAGSGEAPDLAEVVTIARRLCPETSADITIDPAGSGPPTGFSALDIGRAQEALNYTPRPLAQGLAELIEQAR